MALKRRGRTIIISGIKVTSSRASSIVIYREVLTVFFCDRCPGYAAAHNDEGHGCTCALDGSRTF